MNQNDATVNRSLEIQRQKTKTLQRTIELAWHFSMHEHDMFMISSSLLISVWRCLAVAKSINPSLGLLPVSPWRYHQCATLANVLLGDTEKNHLEAHSPEGDDSDDALSKERLPFQVFTVTFTYSFLNMHVHLQFEGPVSFCGFATTIITLTFPYSWFLLDCCLMILQTSKIQSEPSLCRWGLRD